MEKSTKKQSYPRYLDIQIRDKFKGLYTCHCHLFESYEALKKANLQKLKVGDIVKNRCTGEVNTIFEIKDKVWIHFEKKKTKGVNFLGGHISEFELIKDNNSIIEQKRIINFSGGLSSAMMTILEYNPNTDFVVWADTGREHPKTYKFVNDFEANEGIPIHRIMYENEFGKGFTALYTKKKIIPNRQFRTCSVELKITLATRYARSFLGLKKMDWMIGFRGDEKKRVDNYECQKYKRPIFPLYEKGILLDDVFDFWSTKNYTLEIPRILGNCDLCFLKGKDNLIKIMKHYPEWADKWIEDEERNKKTFIKGITYRKLREIANRTKELFPLQNLESAYPQCNCTQV